MNLREIDALVAEKVMGLHDTHAIQYGEKAIPNYSTDISAAWEVVEKMMKGEAGPIGSLQIDCMWPEWRVKYLDTITRSDSAPLAIALAALKSVGVEV